MNVCNGPTCCAVGRSSGFIFNIFLGSRELDETNFCSSVNIRLTAPWLASTQRLPDLTARKSPMRP